MDPDRFKIIEEKLDKLYEILLALAEDDNDTIVDE